MGPGLTKWVIRSGTEEGVMFSIKVKAGRRMAEVAISFDLSWWSWPWW